MGWIYMLVSFLLVLMIYAFCLRLILKVMHVSPTNAIHQWLMNKTDLLLLPLNPYFKGVMFGEIEGACLLVLFLLELLQGYVLVGVFYHTWFSIWHLPFLMIGDVLIYILNIFFFAMLFRMVLGLLNEETFPSLRELVNRLTLPLIRYSRDFIPIMGGIDVSPLFWMILLKAMAFVIYASLSVHL